MGYSDTPSRAQTPYLLSGLTDAVETRNCSNEMVKTKLDTHEAYLETHGEEDEHHIHCKDEKEFTRATDGVEKSLQNLHRQLENFNGTGNGAKRRPGTGKNATKQNIYMDDDEDDEEGESMRERFEMYKMVRKIEPELPPLTPLPPLSTSKRLPDTPLVEYNLSLEAIEKTSLEARTEFFRRGKVHREQKTSQAAWRRLHQLDQSRELWEKALRQKKKQAEDVLAARRDGGNNAKQGVPKDVVAERWVVVYAMAAFLQTAREEVVFSRKPADERRAEIVQREAEGKMKRTDVLHMQNIKIDQYMKDPCLISRLDMLARLFQAKLRIREKHQHIHLVALCLRKWQPNAAVFLAFKKHIKRIIFLQGWWRSKSRELKEIREHIVKRWEKIERSGTSGWQPPSHHNEHVKGDSFEHAKRMLFIEHELRARRFYGLTAIAIWEEEAAKWQEVERERKEQGLKTNPDIKLAPSRPSHLPPNHLPTEGPHRQCPEWCLGRVGDNEILAMIKASRSNPKGGGWKQIPQKKTIMEGKKKQHEDHVDTGPERLFGEAGPDDLQRWGVHPDDMPRIGQKPAGDDWEGEGCYP